MTLREALDILDLNPNSLDRELLETTLRKNLESIELRNVMRLMEAYRKANAFINPTLATHGDVRVTLIDEPIPDGPPMNLRPAAKRLSEDNSQRLKRDFAPGATFDESILKAPNDTIAPVYDPKAFETQEMMIGEVVGQNSVYTDENIEIVPTETKKVAQQSATGFWGMMVLGAVAAAGLGYFGASVLLPPLLGIPAQTASVQTPPTTLDQPATAAPKPVVPKPNTSSQPATNTKPSTTVDPSTSSATKPIATTKPPVSSNTKPDTSSNTKPGTPSQPSTPTMATVTAKPDTIKPNTSSVITTDTTKLEAERTAKLEAERKAKLEAQRLAKLEAERTAKLEAQRLAKIEAARLAKLEAERTAKLEAARLAKLEAQRVAQVQQKADQAAAQALVDRQAQRRLAARREANRVAAERQAERVAAERRAERVAARRAAIVAAEKRAAARVAAKPKPTVSVRAANQGSFNAWDRAGAVLRYPSWSAVPDAVRALPPAQFRATVYVASSPATLPGLPR